MPGFDLFIFDCDGVLVDSERIANQVFAKILNEECGLSLDLAKFWLMNNRLSREALINSD
jgi:beta-phosphoglucomutase-like phosphatase (HAD superfamily)